MASNSDGLELVARQMCALTDMVGYIEDFNSQVHHRYPPPFPGNRLHAIE